MAAEMDLFKTPTEPSFFVGQVQSEIFTSPDSFYKVLIVSVEEANFDWNETEITVTGSSVTSVTTRPTASRDSWLTTRATAASFRPSPTTSTSRPVGRG